MCLSCISKKSVFTVLFLLILISTVFQSINQPVVPKKTKNTTSPTTIPTTSNPQTVKVTRVIDGDTIEIESGQKVRYIGINTPELHDPRKSVECFAQEAYIKNKELVEGKTIRLEKDVSETDKYQRLLRYVYLENLNATNEALFVNKYLVEQGFALASAYPPDVKYAKIFTASQQQAEQNRTGLWNKCQ